VSRSWRIGLWACLAALTVAVRWPCVAARAAPRSVFAIFHALAEVVNQPNGLWHVWGRHPLPRYGWAPDSAWPPLWPLWLRELYRLPGDDLAAGRAGNLVLAVLAGALLCAAGNRLRPGAGFAAWGLWALAPHAIAYAGLLGSENLSIPLFAAALLLALQRRWAWCGVATGLTLLTRQAYLPMAAVLILACWVRERRGGRVAVMVGAVAVVILPWSVNRSVVLGGPVLLTNSGGFNVYMGTCWANPRGYWFDPAEEEWIAHGRDPGADRHFLTKAVGNVLLYPGRFLEGCWYKARVWAACVAYDFYERGPWPGLSALEAHTRPLWTGLALVGTILGLVRRNRQVLLIAACYWGYALSVIFTYMGVRMVLPSVPLAALLGASVWPRRLMGSSGRSSLARALGGLTSSQP